MLLADLCLNLHKHVQTSPNQLPNRHIIKFQISHENWWTALILGILSIIAGGFVFFFPETRHMPLPETVADIEEWDRNRRWASNDTEGVDQSRNVLVSDPGPDSELQPIGVAVQENLEL